MERKQLHIRLNPKNHKDIKILAAKHGHTISIEIEQAIREFVLKHKGAK